MLETKQLYEGAEKTPFYPKVPLQALSGIAPNTTLEDNVKTISKTVYGTETPGKTSSTPSIDTVQEVYDFLSGYDNLQKLSDLIGNGGGSSKVSVSDTYDTGKPIATVKIDGNPTVINVPSSVVYDSMGSANLWKLVYNPDTTLLKLIFNGTPIANVYLSAEGASSLYLKPSAPANISAEYNSSTGIIKVSWNPVWENHTEGIDDAYVPTYEIQKYINGDAVGERITVSNGNTTYLDTKIIPNVTYEYVVYARSIESELLSDSSARSNPVYTLSDEDDATKSIEIDFPDDQVSNSSYAGGEYTNILRQMGSVETYNGIVAVYGSMATLNKVSYAKVLNFDGEELTVSLGTIRPFGNTYYKEGTVEITRNNKGVPLNTTLAIYAMPSTGNTHIIYGDHTYNFVYPIYTGYVEESMWNEAVLNNNVDSSVTVINHGNALNDANPVGLIDGYLINNATFTCNLTASQKEDSNFTRGYVQIAIPLNLHYVGYGITTDPDNMPTVFKTTGALETTIPGMEKASKRVVSAKGVTYWVYTASTSSKKSLISSNGSTLKAIV